MSENHIVDELSYTADDLLEQVKQLVKAGSAKKLTVRQGDKILLKVPLTAGLVGAMIAPSLAALGIFSALLTKCTITIEDAT